MKALMIIAHENFRDEEYQEPRKILEENGIEVTVASWDTGTAIGKFGTQVTVDTIINEVDINPYNSIIYIGGTGCKEYWNNISAHKIAQDAFVLKKILAAICSAPVILARAGVLKGKKATCFSGDAQELKKEGVVYVNKSVVRDGLIITADGPNSAAEFGTTIVKMMS